MGMAHAFPPERCFRVVGHTDDATPGLIIDPPLPPTPDDGGYAGSFLRFGEERVTITGDQADADGGIDQIWLDRAGKRALRTGRRASSQRSTAITPGTKTTKKRAERQTGKDESMIDVQTEPELQPLTIPDARPSQILRSIPRDRFCRKVLADRDNTACAVGHLARHAGVSVRWPEVMYTAEADRVYRAVMNAYGLPAVAIEAITLLNDGEGPDAVITYLESLGK